MDESSYLRTLITDINAALITQASRKKVFAKRCNDWRKKYMRQWDIEGAIVMDEDSLEHQQFLMEMAQSFLEAPRKPKYPPRDITNGAFYWGKTTKEKLLYPRDRTVIIGHLVRLFRAKNARARIQPAGESQEMSPSNRTRNTIDMLKSCVAGGLSDEDTSSGERELITAETPTLKSSDSGASLETEWNMSLRSRASTDKSRSKSLEHSQRQTGQSRPTLRRTYGKRGREDDITSELAPDTCSPTFSGGNEDHPRAASSVNFNDELEQRSRSKRAKGKRHENLSNKNKQLSRSPLPTTKFFSRAACKSAPSSYDDPFSTLYPTNETDSMFQSNNRHQAEDFSSGLSELSSCGDEQFESDIEELDASSVNRQRADAPTSANPAVGVSRSNEELAADGKTTSLHDNMPTRQLDSDPLRARIGSSLVESCTMLPAHADAPLAQSLDTGEVLIELQEADHAMPTEEGSVDIKPEPFVCVPGPLNNGEAVQSSKPDVSNNIPEENKSPIVSHAAKDLTWNSKFPMARIYAVDSQQGERSTDRLSGALMDISLQALQEEVSDLVENTEFQKVEFKVYGREASLMRPGRFRFRNRILRDDEAAFGEVKAELEQFAECFEDGKTGFITIELL